MVKTTVYKKRIIALLLLQVMSAYLISLLPIEKEIAGFIGIILGALVTLLFMSKFDLWDHDIVADK